jgi:hypothetical protein
MQRYGWREIFLDGGRAALRISAVSFSELTAEMQGSAVETCYQVSSNA